MSVSANYTRNEKTQEISIINIEFILGEFEDRSDGLGGIGSIGFDLDFGALRGGEHQNAEERFRIYGEVLVGQINISFEIRCAANEFGRGPRVQPFFINDDEKFFHF